MTNPAPLSYQDACSHFDAEHSYAPLAGSVDTGFNAYHELCGRYGQSQEIALRWMANDGRTEEWTFSELERKATAFANMLIARGANPGDRVAGLLPRRPELLVVLLGTLRAGCVYQPLFTAFGPRAIESRLAVSEPVLVVTDRANRPKLDDIAQIAVLDIDATSGAESFLQAMEAEVQDRAPPQLPADAPFLMMFTSGTTGTPKGVLVPIHMLRAIWGYMRYGIDLRPEDRFWNLADPGWAYGLYYGICGPLLFGQAVTLNEAAFSVERSYEVLSVFGITNFAGAPTAFRAMVNSPLQPPDGVRVISSAGETLDKATANALRDRFGCPARDHWGQTELGMVLCAHHGLDHPHRDGSIGFASPGWRAVTLDPNGDECKPGKAGALAIDRRSELYWFEGYVGRTEQPFVGNYFLAGDTVVRDEDGMFSFVGRDDDVITSSGYRIGPTEVEAALLEHPLVAEAAVIGRPDAVRTEVVKAFVRLKEDAKESSALATQIGEFVKQRLAAHAYPREVEFVYELPKTASGKVQRFLLRQQEATKVAAKQP